MHIRARSEFSVTDGIVRVEDHVRACQELGLEFASLTDLNSLRGIPDLFRWSKHYQVRAIPGIDLLVSPLDLSSDTHYRVTLIAKSEAGYRGLVNLLAEVNRLDNRTIDGELITPEAKLRQHYSGDWFVLSGGIDGLACHDLSRGNTHHALLAVTRYKLLFGDDFFLEISRAGRSSEQGIGSLLIDVSRTLAVQTVASLDVRMTPDIDARILSVRAPHKEVSSSQRLVPSKELESLFSDIPESIESLKRIVESVNVKSIAGSIGLSLSPFPRLAPDGVDEFLLLQDAAHKGLRKRVAGFGVSVDLLHARLSEELALIRKHGLERLFLFLKGVGRHSVDNGGGVVLVGGAVGSTLVACAIGVALPGQVLLRQSASDLFASFLDEKHFLRIIVGKGQEDFAEEYIRSHYGRSRVASISDVWRHGVKSSIRAAGAALGVDSVAVERMCQLASSECSLSLQLNDPESPLYDAVGSSEDVRAVMEMAAGLEGRVGGERVVKSRLIMSPFDVKSMGVPFTVDSESRVSIAAQGLNLLSGLLTIDVSPSTTLAAHNAIVARMNQQDIDNLDCSHGGTMESGLRDPRFWRSLGFSLRHDLNVPATFNAEDLARELAVAGMDHLDKAIARREASLPFRHLHLAATLIRLDAMMRSMPELSDNELCDIHPIVGSLASDVYGSSSHQPEPPEQGSLFP